MSRIKVSKESEYFKINEQTGRFRFVPKILGDELLSQFYFVTNRDSKEVFVFDETHYKGYGETFIHERCIEKLGEDYKEVCFKEVLNYIRGKSYRFFDEEPPLNFANIENGILDLITKDVYPHNPKYLFFHKIPLRYKPESKSPTFLQFLLDVTANTEDALDILKFIGYCILRANPYETCLLLVGDGGNGKSKLFSAVQIYLGLENISNRSLHALCKDKFAAYDLFGKLANLCGDLPRKPLKILDMFLRIVGGDSIPIEKKFHDARQFRPYQKLAFASNQPPIPEDSNTAFYRRLMMKPFPNSFFGKDRDPTILQKMTTNEEKDGILELIVDALNILIFEEGFNQDVEETQKNYLKWADPIERFFEDCVFETDNETTHKKELFKTYVNYCKEHNYNHEKSSDFNEAVVNRGFTEKRVQNLRHWDGISLTEEGTKYLKQKQSGQQTLVRKTEVCQNAKNSENITKETLTDLKILLREKREKIGNLALLSKWSLLSTNIYQNQENNNESLDKKDDSSEKTDRPEALPKTKNEEKKNGKKKKKKHESVKTKLAKLKFNINTTISSQCFLCGNPIYNTEELDKYEKRIVHKKCKNAIDAQKKAEDRGDSQ